MIILVSGATRDVHRSSPARVGVLFVPRARTNPAIAAGRTCAIDNGSYRGFDADAFLQLLAQLKGIAGCRFAAAPDVVADAVRTLELFETWEPVIRSFGFPVALVAQDGLEPRAVPWSRIDALFIGGSTEWKMSPAAETLLAYAAALGKWRHVGRVNTRRRVRHFAGRCDSFDGSGFSKWPGHIKGRGERWLAQLELAPRLPHW